MPGPTLLDILLHRFLPQSNTNGMDAAVRRQVQQAPQQDMSIPLPTPPPAPQLPMGARAGIPSPFGSRPSMPPMQLGALPPSTPGMPPIKMGANPWTPQPRVGINPAERGLALNPISTPKSGPGDIAASPLPSSPIGGMMDSLPNGAGSNPSDWASAMNDPSDQPLPSSPTPDQGLGMPTGSAPSGQVPQALQHHNKFGGFFKKVLGI